MRIAIIGSGGREHAIAWHLQQHHDPQDIYVLPGNGGVENRVAIAASDFSQVANFCREQKIEGVIVGPEALLATGLVDYLESHNILAFGPRRSAARLESSKVWAKQFMTRHQVATAKFWLAADRQQAQTVIDQLEGKCVIKFSGLALGKGVFVCETPQHAQAALDKLAVLQKVGNGEPLLIEEKLEGPELSLLAFVDGHSLKLMPAACDYKRAFYGDRGPNTGGMGAFAPAPIFDSTLASIVDEQIVAPTLEGLQKEKIDFRGVLYFGLILTKHGPCLLEYNVRFGDPEAEVLLPALNTDLWEIIRACRHQTLDHQCIKWSDKYFLDVVLASDGYPERASASQPITGLDAVLDDVKVFHGATVCQDGKYFTNGGRVLHVVGQGSCLDEAAAAAYRGCSQISFAGMHYRRDIGARFLLREP